MSRATISETHTKTPRQENFSKLRDIFIQYGPDIPKDRVAVLLFELHNEKTSMCTREERNLYRLAVAQIKGTFWEEILFPPSLSPEEMAYKKHVDKLEDHFQGQIQNIENACNDWLTWMENTK